MTQRQISDYGVFDNVYTKRILKNVSRENFNKAMECLIERENKYNLNPKFINLIQAVIYWKSLKDTMESNKRKYDRLEYENKNIDKKFGGNVSPYDKKILIACNKREMSEMLLGNKKEVETLHAVSQYIKDLFAGNRTDSYFGEMSLVFHSCY